jgi:putative oxidoreductase
MDAALAIGRILLAAIFIFSGIGKFADVPGTAAYIASKGLPLPEVLTLVSGAVELIGGMLIVIGWQVRLAAVVLLLFTAAAAGLFHDFWHLPAGAERDDQMIHALKNLSIVGGFLVLAAAGPGRFSIDGRARA